MSALVRRSVIAFAVALLAAAIVQTAWLCDDAFITFRTVDNFLHGYGLRWNIAERVQGYTHPLWMLVILCAGLVTRGELFLSVTLISIVISVAGFALLALGIARSPWRVLWLAAALAMSRTFLSFATSGLESPLTHLLLIAALYVWLRWPAGRRRLIALSCLTGLALLNRMDSVLLIGPAFTLSILDEKPRHRAFALAAVGFVPFIAWEGFSLIYYGSLVPNTAHAKLATGIPSSLLALQGLRYARTFALWDGLSAALIMLGFVVALLPDHRRRYLPIAVGMALHVVYVVRVGGDFMNGRFFAAPLLCAVVLLADVMPRFGVLWLLPLPLLGVFSIGGNLWKWIRGVRPEYYANGITDERIYSWHSTGLLSPQRQRPDTLDAHYLPRFGRDLVRNKKNVVVECCIGQVGYYAGPTIHIIDNYALTDPLLARLPVNNRRSWRIGHFNRTVPPGYEETQRAGKNVIRDPDLANYYEKLELLARGPLLSRQRLLVILEMLVGRYEPLRMNYLQRTMPR